MKIIAVSLLFAAGAALANPKPKVVSEAELAAAADTAMITKAQGVIARGLIDPESARFRDVFISPNRGAVCGEMNAKNRMGGYVGFRRFIVTAEKSGVEEDGTFFAESHWEERCRIDAVAPKL